MTAPAPFDIEALRRARAAPRIGKVIHYFDSLDSTFTVAHHLAATGAAEGTVVIAETQTKGRGRLGRAWVSAPFRNLYTSIILRPRVPVSAAPQITLVAGLAAVEAVDGWVERAAIKWPNDVVIDGRKVAGILTEMEADGERIDCVILGIGVNLNSAAEDFPPDLRDKAVGLCTAAGHSIDRVAFTDRLFARLEVHYDSFVSQGFAAMRAVWEGRSYLTGRRVQIEGGGQRLDGIVTGVADDGTLLLRDATGNAIRAVVGDVTVVDGYDSSDQRSAISSQRTTDGRKS